MKTLVLKDYKLYLQLHKQHIFLGRMYTSPVRNVGLTRNKTIILRMQKKFTRKVAYHYDTRMHDAGFDDILSSTNVAKRWKSAGLCAD